MRYSPKNVYLCEQNNIKIKLSLKVSRNKKHRHIYIFQPKQDNITDISIVLPIKLMLSPLSIGWLNYIKRDYSKHNVGVILLVTCLVFCINHQRILTSRNHRLVNQQMKLQTFLY